MRTERSSMIEHGALYGRAAARDAIPNVARPLLRAAPGRSDAAQPADAELRAAPTEEADMCVPGCQEALQAALSRRGFFKGAAAAGFAATVIEPAEAKKKPRRRPARRRTKAPEGQSYFKGVVDLTHTMSPDFPTFFGVPGIELQKQFDFKKDGFNLNWWRIIEHAGTHLDAPIHFSENGATADTIGAGELVVPLAVIDVRKQAEKNPDYLMGIEDVLIWEKRFKKLPDSCCVAMLSGWGAHVGDAAKFTGKDASGTFHFPGISPELAEWLLKERKVLGLAVDTLSLDNGPSKDFKTHHIWLPAGRWGLENVANLEKLPPSEAHPGGGLAQGERLHRRPGAADRADLICYLPARAHVARGAGRNSNGQHSEVSCRSYRHVCACQFGVRRGAVFGAVGGSDDGGLRHRRDRAGDGLRAGPDLGWAFQSGRDLRLVGGGSLSDQRRDPLHHRAVDRRHRCRSRVLRHPGRRAGGQMERLRGRSRTSTAARDTSRCFRSR